MNRLISAFVALAVALAVFSSMVFAVDRRQYVVVFAFGEIKQIIREPGLHLRLSPPLQNVVFMDKRLQTIGMADTDRFITAGKGSLLIDWFMKWRVSDLRLFYVSFRGNSHLVQDSMMQKINSIARDEFTRRMVSDVVSTDRETVMQSILKGIQECGKSVDMDIIGVHLKRMDLLASVTEPVYRRMETERKHATNELRSTGAAESEKIHAGTDRQREVVLADTYHDAQKIRDEGDAHAVDIHAGASGRDPQFTVFWCFMEAYRASLRDRKNVLVLQPNNSFFKYVHSPSSDSSAAAPATRTGRHRWCSTSLII